MWLELIWWIYNVLIFHQRILLIACEPSLNLITNYLIYVAGKQWEALRFTIEVCTCMVLCLIAHYCAIAGTILIFRFLTIWSFHVGPAARGFDPLFDSFCMLQYDESGLLHMFYTILPEREQQEWLASSCVVLVLSCPCSSSWTYNLQVICFCGLIYERL